MLSALSLLVVLYSYLNLESTKTLHYYRRPMFLVVQLLKSWEYKNATDLSLDEPRVVQLLKSWEYKNSVAL